MATTTKTRGISLACPHCHAIHDDDSVRGLCVELGNLTLYCSECSETVTRSDLERVRGEVDRMLRLLDAIEAV